MSIQDRDFERVMNQARVQLTGSSEAGLKGTLFDVLDEFCDVSNCWVEWLQIAIQTSTQMYQIFPQHGGMINRLITALDTNQVVLPGALSFGDSPASFVGQPNSYVNPPGVIFSLTYPQNTSYTANILVSKKIILPNSKDDVPDGPGWLIPKYGRYITEGLIGSMMTQPGTSYTSVAGAQFHLRKFRDGMAMAKTETMRANIFGAQSWSYPRQYRTNSQRGGVSTPFPSPSGQGI